ncbi:MAG: hypothetical protein ABL888_13275 [Pirellulaceae bacterium]
MSGNKQTCPFCGDFADLFDGTFDVVGDVIDVLKPGNISEDLLSKFVDLAKKSKKENTTFEAFAKQADDISPVLGHFVRQASGKIPLQAFLLIAILIATNSCNMNITFDANQFIESISNKPSHQLIKDSEKQNIDSGTNSAKDGSSGNTPPK